MSCIHGHSAFCNCGDCRIAKCAVASTSYEVIAALPEPRDRALITCQVQSGPDMAWTNRIYEFVRAADGQWLIDFGDGWCEPRRSWDDVLDWLRRMRPRDVEMLEAP